MRHEPHTTRSKTFEELARRPDGSIITAAERAPRRKPSRANFEGGLGIPGLRKRVRKVLGSMEGEGEG
ncbi:MAG: hypothetical protein ABIG34_03670 [Candidatus Peregrinibacteria bacterium]